MITQEEYRKKFPPHPNYPTRPTPAYVPASLVYLNNHLRSDHKVCEFGSGASTLWYAERVNELLSVEHDPKWYKRITAELSALDLKCNYTYLLEKRPYHQAISPYPDEYFDIIIVDGRDRVRCIKESIPKLKTGGVLILDNSDRVDRYKKGLLLLEDWASVEYDDYERIHYKPCLPWRTTIFTK